MKTVINSADTVSTGSSHSGRLGAVLMLILLSQAGCRTAIKLDPVAVVTTNSSASYNVAIRGEITTYGGMPDTLFIRFPMRDTYTLAMDLRLQRLQGKIPAEEVLLSRQGSSPLEELKGYVAFQDQTMEVKLQTAHYSGREKWWERKFFPFELNGIYKLSYPDSKN